MQKESDVKMKNDTKGRDIFFGVVALATLIVAIIGATLAYFSITASSNEGAINATAAVVSIEYKDGQQVTAQADQLIPSTLSVVQTVYEARFKDAQNVENPEDAGNICIDSNGKQVCSAYRFTIRSDVERTVKASLNNEENGFTYLSYAVYKVSGDKPGWMPLNDENDYFLDLTTCSNANNEGDQANTDDDCFVQEGLQKKYTDAARNSIFGKRIEAGSPEPVYKSELVSGTTQVYDLVLFIRETNENQNIDQGKNYRGTIIVDVLDGTSGGNISGYVDPEDENFQ